MKKIWFRAGMEACIPDSDWRILQKFYGSHIYKNSKGKYVCMESDSITQAEIDKAVEIMQDMIIGGTLSGETYIPEEFGDSRYANEMEINFEF